MKKVVLASVLLLSISSVHAVDSVRWDSASVSYQTISIEEENLTGFGVSGTKLIGDDFFVTGTYSTVSEDIDIFGAKVNLDLNTLSAGLGYRHAISSKTDVFGIVSYQDMEVKASYQQNSGGDSDSGYGLQAGIRSLVTENIELSGSLNYIDIGDDSETGFNISAIYHFTNQFSAGVGYGKSDDVDSFNLSAVYFF